MRKRDWVKKWLIITTSLMLVLSLFTTTVGNVAKADVVQMEGNGEPDTPWQIRDDWDLESIGSGDYELSDHYILVNDINLAGINWDPIGSEDEPFTGSFDGDGYTISNLTIDRPGEDYVGLFSVIQGVSVEDYEFEGKVFDLNIVLGTEGIKGGNYVGAVAGKIETYSDFRHPTGSITLVNVKGQVTGQENVGGLVGAAMGEADLPAYLLYNSYEEGEITGKSSVGGMAGSVDYTVVYNSSVLDSVQVNASDDQLGGLVGYASYDSNISRSYSAAVVSGDSENSDFVGGLVGRSSVSYIDDSYSLSTAVSGNSEVGGLVGYAADSEIVHSYAAAVVSGIEDLGGLIGQNSDSYVISSYWDTEVSGIPDNSDEDYGVGKLTSEMQDDTTYTSHVEEWENWDFEHIWKMEPSSYPQLYGGMDIRFKTVPNWISNQSENVHDITLNLSSEYVSPGQVIDIYQPGNNTPVKTINSLISLYFSTNLNITFDATGKDNGIFTMDDYGYYLMDQAGHRTSIFIPTVQMDSISPTWPEDAKITANDQVSEGSLVLNWEDAEDGEGSGIHYYLVYVDGELVDAKPAGSTYSVDLPLVSTTYEVEAVDRAGNKTSEKLKLVFSNGVEPVAPTGLTATGGDGLVNLSWEALPEVTGYHLYMGMETGVDSTNADKTVTVTEATYEMTGLTNGTKYYFAVSAYNDAGESPVSVEVNATPQASASDPSSVTLTAPATAEEGTMVSFDAVISGVPSYLDPVTMFPNYAGKVSFYVDGEFVTQAPPLPSGIAEIAAAKFLTEELSEGVHTIEAVYEGYEGDFHGTYYNVASSADSVEIMITAAQGGDGPLAPNAPTGLRATAGDGLVNLSWNAVPEVSGYHIYMGTEEGVKSTNADKKVTLTQATYGMSVTDVTYGWTGLNNGTTYYFAVSAFNEAGEGKTSMDVSATPQASAPDPDPSDDDDDTFEPAPTPSNGVDVLMNGKVENAGTLSMQTVNGQEVATVMIDSEKLEERLASEASGAVITIPISAESDVVIVALDGEMLWNMEQKEATIEMATDHGSYRLPAEQLNIRALSEQFGQDVALEDIQIQIEISTLSEGMIQVVEHTEATGEFTIMAPPLNFKVTTNYGDATVEVTKFNAYVERTIAVPADVDPNKITTGIIVDEDGTVHHVPTQVVNVDGKYYAKINSLSNSTYALIWHPREFTDVQNHWAKQAVNDMGSRMVVSGTSDSLFNPNEAITRAEFTAIVVRGLGLQSGNEANVFSDVLATKWYYDAIQAAHEYGLISGFADGTFRPNDQITREQATLMISKAMKITNLQNKLERLSSDDLLQPFKDASNVSSWAKSGVLDTIRANIITGRGNGQLAPKAQVTRAEAAMIIRQLLRESGLI